MIQKFLTKYNYLVKAFCLGSMGMLLIMWMLFSAFFILGIAYIAQDSAVVKEMGIWYYVALALCISPIIVCGKMCAEKLFEMS